MTEALIIKLFWQSEDLPDKTIVKVYESEEGDICFEKNLMSPLFLMRKLRYNKNTAISCERSGHRRKTEWIKRF